MTKKLSKQLCELCNIPFERHIDNCRVVDNDGDLCEQYVEILDFGQPENFVKLLELDILTGCTLWSWLSVQGVFMARKETLLRTIYLILSGNVRFCDEFCDEPTLKQIKQSIRDSEWVYLSAEEVEEVE